MDTEEKGDPSPREEAWRLIDFVRFLARLLEITNTELARRSGVPRATLVRYFSGKGEPTIELLLTLVTALGLEPREFLELAYPKDGRAQWADDPEPEPELANENSPDADATGEGSEEASEEPGEGLEVGEEPEEGSTEEAPSKPEVPEEQEEMQE